MTSTAFANVLIFFRVIINLLSDNLQVRQTSTVITIDKKLFEKLYPFIKKHFMCY